MSNYDKVLLISTDDIKAQSIINYNVDDTITAQAILTAQDTYLPDVIGRDLVKVLKELVFNSAKDLTPSIDDEDRTQYSDLLDLVEKYLIKQTQCTALDKVTFKIRNIGVDKQSDTNIQTATIQDIIYLRKQLEVEAAAMATEISEYLKNNKEYFPELDNVPCKGGKLKLGKVFTTSNLWLN